MEITDSKKLNSPSKSVEKFTNVMFKDLLETKKQNYICSTLSAHIALSMAAYGADKNTAVEMRKVLCISDHDSDLLEDYQRIMDNLNVDEENDEDNSESDKSCEEETTEILKEESLSQRKLEGYDDRFEREMYEESKLRREKIKSIVRLANKIIISDTVKVHEDYKHLLSMYFRSKSETFNFEEQEKSAEMINSWCAEITNGKIQNIVSPGQFTESTALFLINAVYFKGKWNHDFKPAFPKIFHLNLLKKTIVPTMYLKRKLNYRELPELNAKSVRLDFAEGEKYMEIIVPNKINGLKTVVKNLDNIDEKEFKYVRVRFWMPKFKIRSEIKFENHLEKMGMVDAFDGENANFNKISPSKLFINAVLQQAYIKVDELGCEAAAVTMVEMMQACLSLNRIKPKYLTIKANRPFLFRIMDSRLNVPLFIGTVVNPIE